MTIVVTFWGKEISILQNTHPVILVKGCKIADFAGWSLNVNSENDIIVNPACDWSKDLREWYDKLDKSDIADFHNHSIGIHLNPEKKDDCVWTWWKKKEKKQEEEKQEE